MGAFENVRDNRVPRSVVATIEQLAAHASLALRNAWLLHDVEELAVTDELTRLANRRQFESALSSELAAAKAHGTTLGFILVDLDRFKALNDTHGHLTGDEVLRRVSDVLVGVTELGDTVARYGGEEFALVLPGRDPVATAAMAERARLAIAALGAPVPVTASFGACSYPADAADGPVAHASGRRGDVRVEAVGPQPGDVRRRPGERLAGPAVALGGVGRRPRRPHPDPSGLTGLDQAVGAAEALDQLGLLLVGDLGEQHRRDGDRVPGRERRRARAATASPCGQVASAAPSASSTVADDVGMIGDASTASTRTTLITVRKMTAAASGSAFTTFHGSLCSQ